jgi:hypothetical protein
MEIEIKENFTLDLYGVSGIAENKDYVRTVFRLSDAMWQEVKGKGLQHKGKNIWVYESNDKLFAGVELIHLPGQDTKLEHKIIHLVKYAYYKHIGLYNLIKQLGQKMTSELKKKGWEVDGTYIEIYGHWTNDETKAETELLMCLK